MYAPEKLIRKIGLILLLSVVFISFSEAQAVFESNVSGGSGNWNSAGSWTRISGSDGDDVPDSNDDVTILAGDEIDLTTATTNVDDLTIAGTLDIAGNNRTINVGGNLVMSGTSAITGNNATRTINVTGTFDVSTSASATINGENVNVTGDTTIDGTLTYGNNRGDKTFGNVTISSTGNWNNTVRESFTISGDWTNNGSFTACSNQACDYEFTSSSGTFSGSSSSTFTDIVINGSANYSNTGTLVISDEIRGTGTYINANGSSLELQGAGPFGTTTFTLSTSANTVTYGGGSNPSIVATTYDNLTINKSGGTASNAGTITVNNDLTVVSNLDINNTFNVSNDVIVQSGILEINGATLTVSRDLSVTGGEFTPNNASAQVDITRDLLMSGSALYDHNLGDVNVTGDLTITGGTFDFDGASSTLDVDDMDLSTGTVTFDNGTVNINSLAGGLTVNSGSFRVNGTALTIDNLYDVNGGTNDLDAGSFNVVGVDIESGDAVTISNITFTSTGTSTINGTLNFDNGTGAYTLNNINVASGGSWNVTAASDFTITGNITHNGTSWTGCSANGCDYTLTSTTGTISGSGAISVSDFIINGSASYTNNGTLTVSDRLTGTGAFTNGANADFTYSGNNASGANFDITSFTASATGNTVTYGRVGDMQLRTTTDTDNNYYNLIVSTGAAGNDVTLAGIITIDNQLTMTVGDIILGTNRLTIEDGATISGGDADSFIRINSTGVLRQNYTASGATLAFPIGDAGDFSPITAFTLTAGTFGAGAFVEFDITDANHPNRNTDNTGAGGNDDGTPATALISRYWTLTGNAIMGEQFDATYQYVDADVTGTEANMVAALYRGLTSPAIDDWLSAGIVTAGSNTVTLTGGDNFGDLYAMDDTLDRLPIVLISFEAKVVEGRVELKWVTGSEENNSFFTIERSTNGLDFEPVLFINGAGDSKTFINYRATDINPKEGLAYYRIKQTDFNGTFSYSELVSVFSAVSHIKPDFTIRGNPLNRAERLVIHRNQQGEARLTIVSLNAEKLMDINLQESESRQLELVLPTSMGPGTYLLVLYQMGYRVSKKLIVN